MTDYEQHIAAKFTTHAASGIDPSEPPPHLFDYQRDLVRWSLRKGRSAVFADTGLGKSAIQIEWARQVSRHGQVLILAPLAVAEQTVREGKRWGVDIVYARSQTSAPITIANYEMLEHFDPRSFAGVVLDESSILKSFTGRTRTALVESFAATPYRLACTATPAPNDFTELGNHSEFLGIKTRTEMLAEYFTHDGGSTQDWRLKGHAETSFWRWVCSWGALIKSPEDLGYDGASHRLPPLRMHERIVYMSHEGALSQGRLFLDDARTIQDQRATRNATMAERAAIAAEIASRPEPCLVWCEYNDEADMAEAAIYGAIQVKGGDSPESKTDRLLGFAEGRYRVLVTKPSIAGFGMNWQNCANVVFMGASHSYEQTYQAVRRCWRYGQTRPVDVTIIRADTEGSIAENFRRKEADAARMASEMGARTREFVQAEVLGASAREWNEYAPKKRMKQPMWRAAA